jgi:hypothetical protein
MLIAIASCSVIIRDLAFAQVDGQFDLSLRKIDQNLDIKIDGFF